MKKSNVIIINTNIFKNIKNLGKRFLGNLNYANIKKSLQYGNEIINGIEHLKGNPLLANKIKELTNNNVYEKVKSGIDTANKLDKIYNSSKDLKIGNVLPVNKNHYNKINRQGINDAFKKRNNLINRKNERQDAIDIANRIR